MKICKILPILMLAVLFFVSDVSAKRSGNAANEGFKNLSGAADEIEKMRLPEVSTLGVRSKSAMLPIKFSRDAAGNAVWSADLPIETSGDLKIALLAPNSRGWQISAEDGKGETDLRRSATVETQMSEVALDGVNYPAEVFTFETVQAGTWRIEINAEKSAKIGETAGYLVVSGKSPLRLYGYFNAYETLVGRNIEFSASIFADTEANAGNVPEALPGIVKSAELTVQTPSGKTETFTLNDNGNGDFRGGFVPREAGQYTAQIIVRGETADGEKFLRTSEHLLQVLNEDVRLGNKIKSEILDENRLRLSIPAEGLREGRKVIAYGEIWAQNESGKKSPVAWLSGMAFAERERKRAFVPLVFDARWLARSDAKFGYELRNVRLQDPDYFINLATADSIALSINALPADAKNYRGEITDEMRMGKKPARQINTPSAPGGKLMLVHGYCSGDAWGSAASAGQFTNFVKFLDLNQNRTHDQFAQRIRTFGASLPSFGIVAHSQGGAASLHLYTYYWSGLDYATGNRLIQSVGTPYQGTSLAGNLAVLGQIFGAGCGSNYDLTYSGASAWLAGIPGWARAKVHYSTTSFTDVWWRYDYCSLATDLFLSDPEDGVVEQSYAQLSGANNRGHKTGWCHTTGMRDPAQTGDASRNADMNTNAAR